MDGQTETYKGGDFVPINLQIQPKLKAASSFLRREAEDLRGSVTCWDHFPSSDRVRIQTQCFFPLTCSPFFHYLDGLLFYYKY